ncbi:MAG: CoA-binding protein, partial [Dongiaceae bacterium]
MNHNAYSDDYIRSILTSVRTIAVVGASPKPDRASHRVMAFLQQSGYRAIPVNPTAAGTIINGETCRASLSDIDE